MKNILNILIITMKNNNILYNILKKNMKKIKRIPINIWDDYYDDGYTPKGEIQKTYIYVVDYDIPHEYRKEYLEFLLDYMKKNLNLDGVKMWIEEYDSWKKYPQFIGTENEILLFKRWEIKVEHLTHKRREKLVKELNDAKLSIDTIPYYIYSES